jgi:hypothetical protein
MRRRAILLITACYFLSAQPLIVNSDNCLLELFSADAGKSNLYARAYNKWAVYIKDTLPGASEASRARYREDLWKLQRDMERTLERLQTSRCYPVFPQH